MRRPTVVLRTAALATSAALVALSAAPGAAAQPLAEGTAVGVTLTVGGTPTDSGAYTVSNDGSGETSTGARDPQIRALGGQSLIRTGTLAQNAATQIRNGDGAVVACAGLAGDGATLAEVGRGNCLRPGNQAQLEAARIDLGAVEFAEGEAVPARLPLSVPARSSATRCWPRPTTRSRSTDPARNPGIFLDLGAIQSTCERGPRRRRG